MVISIFTIYTGVFPFERSDFEAVSRGQGRLVSSYTDLALNGTGDVTLRKWGPLMDEDKTKARLISAENLDEKIVREGEARDFTRRFERMKKTETVYFDGRFSLASEPFKYMWEAGRCYHFGLFLSAIALASAMVESIWNIDPRMIKAEGLKRIQGWVSLNPNNALIARIVGLPIDELLDPDERSLLSKSTNLKFIIRRNKVAHGDIADYITGLPAYSKLADAEAFDQISKADHFFVKWHNQLW